MSLNDIKLSAQLTAGLYGNVLVAKEETTVGNEVKINFLGKNEKNILIVVNKQGIAFLPDKELNFLTSILSACSLSLADVAIINQFHSLHSYHDTINQLHSKTVLLFDVTPGEFGLPVNFPDFQVQPIDHVNYLTAPSLDLLEGNKDLKKSLWIALKRMFTI